MISSLLHYFCQGKEVQVKLYLDTENDDIILCKFSGCIRRSLKNYGERLRRPQPLEIFKKPLLNRVKGEMAKHI